MSEEKIQVLKPLFRVEECLAEIRDCLESSWTGMGYKTTIFEKKWCEYTNLPHAHFLNSATAGLDLGVRILKEKYNWNDGDEIITSAFTFVSTNHAILYHNLKPVFADIDDSLNLSPEDVEKKITSKTKAILFVGLAGWTISTLMSKGKHQDDITKELGNIFESLKLLSSSITALVKLLMKDSIASAKEEDFQPISSNVIDLLKLKKKDEKEVA